MDLLLWFDDFKDNSMYRAWNYLDETGQLDGYETVHYPRLDRRPWRFPYRYVKNYDWIWLFSGPPYHPGMLPISASCFLKENTIFFASSTFWDEPAFPSRTGLSKRAWKFYLENSEVVMATDASQRALEESLGISSRVIPHAVDTDVFHPVESVDRRDDTVLFVGKMIEKKGVPELLSIASENPDIEFWFCGTGELSETVQNTANELEHVRYFGYIDSNIELAKIYSQASMLVLPSIRTEVNGKWEELFGRVIIEAFACGTPVVASNHSGPKSIITTETGITIDQRLIGTVDTQHFEDTIIDLLEDDSTRQSMGSAAREYAVTTFDTEVVANQWLDLFNDIE